MRHSLRSACLAGALLLAGTPAAVHAQTTPPAAPRRTPTSYEYLQNFSDVLNFVRLNYADSVAYGELVRAAIDGVLNSLDPHSYFLAREDFVRVNALDRGELAVTGLAIDVVDGRPTVLGVSEGSPAARARIQPGDRLLTIDDTTAAGIDARHLALRLAGDKGSRVRLRFARGSFLEPDTLKVTLRRDHLTERAVSLVGMADATTGVVKLARFTATSGDEVEAALRELRGKGMQRAILDLRGDPGGYVTAAVDVAGLFLPRGTLVFKTRGRRREADSDYTTQRNGTFKDLPLIVLVDDRSASASEALAGSLQDHDRAAILGRRSFGKALMQQPFFLQSGDVVFLTVGRVTTPSGRFIQRRYEGIGIDQYRELRGTEGAAVDTSKVYQTDAGRVVRGGGGIRPDLELPAPALLPVWFSVASDSSYDTAVADSVAQSLEATPAARDRWFADSAAWRTTLLPPFLARTRAGLGAAALPDPAQASRIARNLAYRVTEVRWGAEAGQRFVLRNDLDYQAALATFPQLRTLLAPPSP
jgi:carboxyl-terminal processing protease